MENPSLTFYLWNVQLFELEDEDVEPVEYLGGEFEGEEEEGDVVREHAPLQPRLVLRAARKKKSRFRDSEFKGELLMGNVPCG